MVSLPLGEDYCNITPLKEGGMGQLYKAYRQGLQIDVVIKRIKAQYIGKINQRAEADILKRLKHQYLPRIYDIINGRDGYLYTVMDYIPGLNMQQYVEQNGPVGQKLAHKWACQLCEVVAYLHEQKPPIIHCDIKPSNLMVTRSGNICLIDFGMSLLFSDGIMARGATSGYAAPEQYSQSGKRFPGSVYRVPSNQPTLLVPEDDPWPFHEEKHNGVSGRTDIYGIGATLYFMITGHVPEKTLGTVTPVSTYAPKVSKTFRIIIERAMEKQPLDRFPDASQMLEALQDVDLLDSRYQHYRMIRWGSNLLLCILFTASVALSIYGGFQLRNERNNLYLSRVSQGETLFQKGNVEQADAVLREAIQSIPGRAEGYLALSYQMYGRGMYRDAFDLIQNALEAGSLKLAGLYEEQAGDLLYIQANCVYEMEDYQSAIALYKEALTYRTDNTAYYRGLALAQARSGNLEEASRTLEMLSDKDPDSLDGFIIRAELALIQGEYQSAYSQYEEISNKTDDPQILSHIYLSGYEALEHLGNLDASINWLSKAVERLGDDGAIQEEMLAEAYTEKALADPENSVHWYQLAENHFQHVIDLDRGNIQTVLNLAVVMENLEEYEEAENCLLSLMEQYPSDYRVYMRLSFFYADWQSQQPVEVRDYADTLAYYNLALQYYEQAVANGENSDEMLQLEALIEQLRIAGWLE